MLPATAINVVRLFQLTLVATLLPLAALGERWGFRNTFLVGLCLIALASVLAACTRHFELLLLARVLQGLGAAAVMAVNPALLRLAVPQVDLGKAIGWNAMVVGIGTALGPSVAAFVLSIGSWSWLFLLNLPWIALAFGLGMRALPQQQSPPPRRFDVAGAALNVAMFVLLSSALQSMASNGWRATLELLLGIGFAGILYRRQKVQIAPLLPLDLLSIPVVRTAVGASVFAFAAQMSALVALPFLLHDSYAMSMLATGMIMMAWPLSVAIMAPIAGYVEARRLSSAALCIGGAMLLSAGLVLLALTNSRVAPSVLFVLMILCGIGFGCFQTPNNRAMISATPRERSGAAGGLQATARLTGQTLGASMVAATYGSFTATTQSAAPRLALLIAAAFALAAACFSVRRRALTRA